MDPSSGPPLVTAARAGDLETVRSLLAQQDARDVEDTFGRSPLYYACLYGHAEVVRLLCRAGCSDLDGSGARAAMRGSGVVEVLAEFALLDDDCGGDSEDGEAESREGESEGEGDDEYGGGYDDDDDDSDVTYFTDFTDQGSESNYSTYSSGYSSSDVSASAPPQSDTGQSGSYRSRGRDGRDGRDGGRAAAAAAATAAAKRRMLAGSRGGASVSANRWAPAKTMEEERALAMAQVRAALNERLRSGKSELGHARKYAAQIRQWRRKRQRQLKDQSRSQMLEDREVVESAWLAKRGQQKANQFTRAQKRELSRWFNMLDTDGSNHIDAHELADPLISTGFAETMADVVKLVKQCDPNGDDQIGFQEFLRILQPPSNAANAGGGTRKEAARKKAARNGASKMHGGGATRGGASGTSRSGGEEDPTVSLAAMKKLQDTLAEAGTLPLETLINSKRRAVIMEAVMGLSAPGTAAAVLAGNDGDKDGGGGAGGGGGSSGGGGGGSGSGLGPADTAASRGMTATERMVEARQKRQKYRYKLKALQEIMVVVKKEEDHMIVDGESENSDSDSDGLDGLMFKTAHKSSMGATGGGLPLGGLKGGKAAPSSSDAERRRLYEHWESVFPVITRGRGRANVGSSGLSGSRSAQLLAGGAGGAGEAGGGTAAGRAEEPPGAPPVTWAACSVKTSTCIGSVSGSCSRTKKRTRRTSCGSKRNTGNVSTRDG